MFKWKNHFGEWYSPHESFVLRTPVFPLEFFFEKNGNESIIDQENLPGILRSFYQQPVAREALLIGSPDLHDQLKLWLDNKIDKTDKREKTELALLKYMIRSCTRSTPYGLFASCTTGKIGDETEIHLEGLDSIRRHGRLDMDYVCQVHTHLVKQKEIRDQLTFFPNSSIYRLGEQIRYIEYRFQEERGRSYHLVQIEPTEYLDNILTKSQEGFRPLELAQILVEDDISEEEALDFIYQLIDSQLLVSELEPNVTGEEYFTALLRKLKSLLHTEEYIIRFERVAQEFCELTKNNLSDKVDIYQRISEHLEPLGIPLHRKTLIQVDSYRPALDCYISQKVCDEILSGASLLHLLTPKSSADNSFSEFINAFRNRYDDQWVPLVEVLDTESGIGYGKFATSGMEESPLIDHLPIGNGKAASNGRTITDADSLQWRLYNEAISQNKTEVWIEDKSLEQIAKKEFLPGNLPDSIFMMVKIHSNSAEHIDQGNYRIALSSPSGPSGANLLGRFCHLDPEIQSLAQNILKQEEEHHPEYIFAEIVHLPESRIGNILMRPVLRKYEIPYLCGTQLDAEYQIPITDLLVGVEGDTVMVRSKRLGKRIIPRMTTAHNYSMTTLPVYQFLCDLQHQKLNGIGWNWGILDNREFLPRVSYGKFVISKARWLLTKEDVKDFNQKEEGKLLDQFSDLVRKKNLPEYILLTQGDNELMLHLKSISCIHLLLQEIQKSGAVVLTETLDIPNQSWITSPEGRHTGELLLSFGKKIKVAAEPSNGTDVRNVIHQPQRIFPVGSEWLYAKIYCGTKTSEKLLCEVLNPLVEELLDEKMIDKYFFIRYHDTGHHIRIRFHHHPGKDFWKEIISRLNARLQPYMLNHSVSNVAFETYQREVERYGLDTMEASEDLFFHQSSSILRFLGMLEGDEGEQYRWQITFKAIDLFLDHFGYSLEQKQDLIKDLQKSFSNEFNIEPPVQRKIAERFYTNKIRIQQVMRDEDVEDVNTQSGIEVFRNISDAYKDSIDRIKNAPSVKGNMKSLNRLMPSYLHMFINRMFVSNQRKMELVIYSHLLKYYDSQIAREKNNIHQVQEEEIKVEA